MEKGTEILEFLIHLFEEQEGIKVRYKIKKKEKKE